MKKRLEVGAYAKNKLPIVEQWLQEQTPKVSVSGADKTPTLVEIYIARIKNHPLLAIVIVGGIVVIAVAQFTDAVSKLASKWQWSQQAIKDIPTIPGDSGWLLLGDIDTKTTTYTRGPFYRVEKSNYASPSALPRTG